jgi:adenylate cyclase
MSPKRTPIRLPLLATLAGGLLLWAVGALDRADDALGDLLVRRHAQSRPAPADVVVVGIDQKSLEALAEVAGQWPWPRAMHAELIDLLAPWKPKAVAFDIMFNEDDEFRPDSDQALREVAATQPNLFFASARLADGDRTKLSLLPPSFGAVRGPDADPEASATLLVPRVFEKEQWRGGLITFEADHDGLGRHNRLWTEIDGWRLPHMAANVAAFAGAELPAQTRVRLHWYGRPPRTISFADLLDDLYSEEPKIAPSLAGSVVLVGVTAPGVHDLRPTPLGSQTLGVEILTTTIANLRAGDWLRDVPVRWPLTALMLATLTAAFARRRRSTFVIGLWHGLSTVFCLIGSAVALRYDLYAPVGAALLLGWLAFGLFTVQAQWLERREREATIGIFGRFLDPRVVAGLVETGELSRDQKPQAKQITILFSDIRGFTTLSETRTPEAVVALLNDYFTRQVDVVFRHGGTLDKFIGDAIMAFWNAPGDVPDHADRGVAAALEMCRQLDEFRAELLKTEPDLGDFDVGIGLHTGPAVVGFLGSDTRMEYTAIGDTVNLGSRIEGTTKGVARVLVSESTRAACDPAKFRFEHRGQFHVKGREQPVDLYEPFASTQH